MSGVVTVASGGVLAGGLALALGIAAAASDGAQALGAAAFGVVIVGGGALVFVLRAGAMAGPAVATGISNVTSWAGNLGARSDAALQEARRVQRAVWLAAGGGPPRTEPFTKRVRTWAQGLMGLAGALLAIAVILVAVGFMNAASGWAEEQTTISPTFTLPRYEPTP